jgi:hypothetical protein
VIAVTWPAARDRADEPQPGLAPGALAGRDRRGLPHAPARRRAPSVPRARRARGQVPRGRPPGQRPALCPESPSAWLALLRSLVARGPAGVRLVTAHPGLVDAIAATLPGACLQPCRTHFMRNPPPRPQRARRASCRRSCAQSPPSPCAVPRASHARILTNRSPCRAGERQTRLACLAACLKPAGRVGRSAGSGVATHRSHRC